MYCSECGHKLQDSAKFCPQCGTAAEADIVSVESAKHKPLSVMTHPASTSNTHFQSAAPPVNSPGRKKNPSVLFVGIAIGIITFFAIGLYVVGPSGPEKESAYKLWMTSAGLFYQDYFRIENEFEIVNQSRNTTHKAAIAAWAKLVQDLQSLQGHLNALQTPPKTSREDAADMVKIRQIWSELLAVEIQMGQQLLQYGQQDRKPPDEFLQGTLPRLWQTKNKLMQEQQQLLMRLAARHPIQAANSAAPSRP